MKGGKSGGGEVRNKPARTWQAPSKGGMGGKGRPMSQDHLCRDGDHCSGGQKGAHGGGKMGGDAC